MKQRMWCRNFALAVLALVTLAGCGGSTKTITETQTVTLQASAATPAPTTATGKPPLATRPKKPGEVIFHGDGLASLGPKKFAGGTYKVRFEQYDLDDPSINFRTDSSSIVIQMNRKPRTITADTVTVTNATKKKGTTSVSLSGGKWYADVSADHSYVVRFTPKG